MKSRIYVINLILVSTSLILLLSLASCSVINKLRPVIANGEEIVLTPSAIKVVEAADNSVQDASNTLQKAIETAEVLVLSTEETEKVLKDVKRELEEEEPNIDYVKSAVHIATEAGKYLVKVSSQHKEKLYEVNAYILEATIIMDELRQQIKAIEQERDLLKDLYVNSERSVSRLTSKSDKYQKDINKLKNRNMVKTKAILFFIIGLSFLAAGLTINKISKIKSR